MRRPRGETGPIASPFTHCCQAKRNRTTRGCCCCAFHACPCVCMPAALRLYPLPPFAPPRFPGSALQVPVREGIAAAAAFALARDVLGPAGGARFRRAPEGGVDHDAVTFFKSVGTAVQASWRRAGSGRKQHSVFFAFCSLR